MALGLLEYHLNHASFGGFLNIILKSKFKWDMNSDKIQYLGPFHHCDSETQICYLSKVDKNTKFIVEARFFRGKSSFVGIKI
jgi:hypothetical protein